MKSILVVDDEEQVLSFLGSLLTSRGYAVLRAGTMASAETILRERPVDLVLADIGLDDGNGFDLRNRNASRCPFLFISGADGPFNTYQSTPGTGFLMKPVSIELLLLRINDLIEEWAITDSRKIAVPGPGAAAD